MKQLTPHGKYDYNFDTHSNYILGSLRSKRLCDRFFIDKLSIFIETGTYMGDGVKWALENDRKSFSKIMSVEYAKGLSDHCNMLFNKFPQVTIENSDTVLFLENITHSLNAPTLFFLDAHKTGGVGADYNKDHPIPLILESNIILDNFYNLNELIVVIDDERASVLDEEYPQIDDLIKLYSAKGLISCYMDDSCIFCSPKWLRSV